jgi:hypothetical protein
VSEETEESVWIQFKPFKVNLGYARLIENQTESNLRKPV